MSNEFYINSLQDKLAITASCSGKFIREDVCCLVICRSNVLEIWAENSEKIKENEEKEETEGFECPLLEKFGQVVFEECIFWTKEIRRYERHSIDREDVLPQDSIFLFTVNMEWAVLHCHESGLQRMFCGMIPDFKIQDSLNIESSIVLSLREEDSMYPAMLFLCFQEPNASKLELYGCLLENCDLESESHIEMKGAAESHSPKQCIKKFGETWRKFGSEVEIISIMELSFLITKKYEGKNQFDGASTAAGKPLLAVLCQEGALKESQYLSPSTVSLHVVALDFESETLLDGGWAVYNVPVTSKICAVPEEMILCVSLHSVELYNASGVQSKINLDLGAYPVSLSPISCSALNGNSGNRKDNDTVDTAYIIADALGELHHLQILDLHTRNAQNLQKQDCLISSQKIDWANNDGPLVRGVKMVCEVSPGFLFIGSPAGDCAIINLKVHIKGLKKQCAIDVVDPKFAENLAPITGGTFVHRSMEAANNSFFNQEELDSMPSILEEPITLALACGSGLNGSICLWEHGIAMEELQQGDLGLPQNITLSAAGSSMLRSDWLFFSDSVSESTYIMEVSDDGEAQPVETCPFSKSELTLAVGSLDQGSIVQVTSSQVLVVSVVDARLVSSHKLELKYGRASLALVGPCGFVSIYTISGNLCLFQTDTMGQISMLFCDRPQRPVSALSLFASGPPPFPKPPLPVLVAAALWDSCTIRIIQSLSARCSVQVNCPLLRHSKSQIRALAFLDRRTSYGRIRAEEAKYHTPLLVAGFTDGRVAVASYKTDLGRPTSSDDLISGELEDVGEFEILNFFQVGCEPVKFVTFVSQLDSKDHRQLEWSPAQYIYANSNRDAVIHFSPASVDANVPVVCTSVTPPSMDRLRRHVVQLTQSQEPHSSAWLSPHGELGLGFLNWGAGRQGSWKKRRLGGEVMALTYLKDVHCIAVAVDRRGLEMTNRLDLFDAETLELCCSQGVVQNHQITSLVNFSPPASRDAQLNPMPTRGASSGLLLALSCIRFNDSLRQVEGPELQGLAQGITTQPTSMVALFEVIKSVDGGDTSTIQLRPCSGLDFTGGCYLLKSLGDMHSHLVSAVDGTIHVLGWLDKREGNGDIETRSPGIYSRPSTAELQRFIFSSLTHQFCADHSSVNTAITALSTHGELIAAAQLFHGILLYKWFQEEESATGKLCLVGTYSEIPILTTIIQFNEHCYFTIFNQQNQTVLVFEYSSAKYKNTEAETNLNISVAFEHRLQGVTCMISGILPYGAQRRLRSAEGLGESSPVLCLGTCSGEMIAIQSLPMRFQGLVEILANHAKADQKKSAKETAEEATNHIKTFVVDEKRCIVGYRKKVSLPIDLTALSDVLKNTKCKNQRSPFTGKDLCFLTECFWDLSL